MDDPSALLLTVTGRDRPGLTTRLLAACDAHGARIVDIEQVVIHDRLILGILVAGPGSQDALAQAVREAVADLGVEVDVQPMRPRPPRARQVRHDVTILGHPLGARALAEVTGRIAACGANIERIVRLSRYPIMSYELQVAGGDPDALRAELAVAAAEQQVDVAVQPASLFRRAKRLVVMDVDSTLVQAEVIELLAARAGCADEVARITAAAMAGELDFEQSLRRRVRMLAGLPHREVLAVRDALVLTPGARTLVRTLKRLGFVLAAVSGGFTEVTDHLQSVLDLDAVHANTLEVVDGRLTGELVGPVVDRAGKAAWLEELAARAGVPLAQTVAVGDGANDLDMLSRAGLGIAFNAKPAVREAADTAVSVPYLDAILFLLGITREEVEAADADDPDYVAGPPIPVEDPTVVSRAP